MKLTHHASRITLAVFAFLIFNFALNADLFQSPDYIANLNQVSSSAPAVKNFGLVQSASLGFGRSDVTLTSVGAGHTIIYIAGARWTDLSGTTTDTAGNVWRTLTNIPAGLGANMVMSVTTNAVAGTTTITNNFSGANLVAWAGEFTNVTAIVSLSVAANSLFLTNNFTLTENSFFVAGWFDNYSDTTTNWIDPGKLRTPLIYSNPTFEFSAYQWLGTSNGGYPAGSYQGISTNTLDRSGWIMGAFK